MIFSVCPHDIVKQMQTWLDFSIYLAAHLDGPVKLRQAIDFKAFYEGLSQSDIVFVNPMDAWRLHTQEQFIPLFQTELYDEVVFFTSEESPDVELSALNERPVGAVDHQFATYLGRYLLEQQGIHIGELRFYDSWIRVIRAVTSNEVPYGILYRDFYTGLRSLTRSVMKVIHESQTGYATHIFMLNPTRQEIRPALAALLASMHQDERGQAILAELGLGQWVPITDLQFIEEIIGESK